MHKIVNIVHCLLISSVHICGTFRHLAVSNVARVHGLCGIQGKGWVKDQFLLRG